MAGFDGNSYDVIRTGVQCSAEVVVPVLLEQLSPAGSIERVLDVGCGEGWWADRFHLAGCEAWGFDAGAPQLDPLGDRRISHDLDRFPWPDLGTFDLVVCLEVLEHLEERSARRAVAELTSRAPLVVFSAAIPGQGGIGHVNEQWPSYWAEIFERRGFAVSGALRWQLWNDDRVENWYRQNLMVAAQDPGVLVDLFETPLAEPLPLVHPVLFDHVRRSR